MKEIASPCEGKILPLKEFPDEIIADGTMGDGFTVMLSGNKIVSPFDGTVAVLYPTGHAVCLESDDGVQMMIHIGAETYALQGLNHACVKAGQSVKKGDLLIRTDVRKMKRKTGSSAAAVVFLNGEKVTALRENKDVKCLDPAAEIQENDHV